MITPADSIAVWLNDAVGPLQYLVSLVTLCGVVSVAIGFLRRAVRSL